MELPIWDSRVQNAESSKSSLAASHTTVVSVDNCDEVFCFLEDFGVLVCKKHYSGVINLDKHLFK